MSERRSFVDRRASIRSELRQIDEIVLLVDGEVDLVKRGHLARLAVIRLSGFIEFSVRHILNAYLEENASHRVLRFGARNVGKLPNLNPSKLEQIVDSFDSDWKDELSVFLAEDERRQTLANLIGARHTLAHGGSTAVSTAKVHQYHEIAEATVDFLLRRFLPISAPRDAGHQA